MSTAINRPEKMFSTGMTDFEQRTAAVKRAQNPLLEAAHVLLRAQADMPARLSQANAAKLRELLMQEVRIFDQLCMQADIRSDHALGAKYSLCTALDEAAMSAAENNQVASTWGTQGLAISFLEDNKGGDKVYLLIARLLNEPGEHHDLLEVIYRILSLGFEGRYRKDPNGPRHHDAIRQRLYEAITAGREPVPLTLSPNWQSNVKRKRFSFFEFPIWYSATTLGLILIGLFFWYRYELSLRSLEVQEQITAIGRLTQPTLPPVAPPSSLYLKQLLRNEIAAGLVNVDEDANHSTVIFRGDEMFMTGGAAVKAAIGPLIAKIAGEITKVPGKVTVFGYTDNVPMRGGKFASNQALSEQRATRVMQMLQATGVPADRLQAVGKGEADPIGDNATAQGRALNRRVEILVTP